MTKEDLFSLRLNNALSVGLGLIALTYVLVALFTSIWSDSGGFTGLAIIGALM